MTNPNDLADRLEEDARRVMWHDDVLQKEDACRWGGVDTFSWSMDMRAAAALLRVQAAQLDTLRNAIGDTDLLLDRAAALRSTNTHRRLSDYLVALADAVDALAAAGPVGGGLS